MEVKKEEFKESAGFHVIGLVIAAGMLVAAVIEYLRSVSQDVLNEAFPLITISALLVIYFGCGIRRARAQQQKENNHGNRNGQQGPGQ